MDAHSAFDCAVVARVVAGAADRAWSGSSAALPWVSLWAEHHRLGAGRVSTGRRGAAAHATAIPSHQLMNPRPMWPSIQWKGHR
jgi:hypothetical protein|eukprot:COSAG01_NODE_152_length_23937_cov_122.193976_2_plen_84_part_00